MPHKHCVTDMVFEKHKPHFLEYLYFNMSKIKQYLRQKTKN